jgi:hypothetical protein
MNVYKIIGVLLHNDTTTNQLHIDEFNKLFYVWSSNQLHVMSKKIKVSEMLRVTIIYIIYSPNFP